MDKKLINEINRSREMMNLNPLLEQDLGDPEYDQIGAQLDQEATQSQNNNKEVGKSRLEKRREKQDTRRKERRDNQDRRREKIQNIPNAVKNKITQVGDDVKNAITQVGDEVRDARTTRIDNKIEKLQNKSDKINRTDNSVEPLQTRNVTSVPLSKDLKTQTQPSIEVKNYDKVWDYKKTGNEYFARKKSNPNGEWINVSNNPKALESIKTNVFKD